MAVSKLDAAGVLHAGKPQLFLWMPWTLALLVDIVWFDAQMKGERCVWGARLHGQIKHFQLHLPATSC